MPSSNPLAFTRWPVTFLTAAVYIAFVVPLLVIHHVVPPAPSTPTPAPGLNLTEAWSDLQLLTNGFRPYNSRKNDLVREWLLRRIREIVDDDDDVSTAGNEQKSQVVVFDDLQSNLTFAGSFDGSTSEGVYFEGTNIIVYVRGTEDDPGRWWEESDDKDNGKSGVLVNAHYDSVSTGYGATDDGTGVVTCLQLLRYFTHPTHTPRRGLVILFNNGEEDFLNGAHVYSQHPVSRFAHTFLNLEGAGAGGRATLFRSSDAEVTRSYGRAPFPFGSVLSANGFEVGLVRSQTDYVVFEGAMGLRGLDVAFMAPRARYHTDQDDARHTSLDSVWHMLSAAVATTEGLVSDTVGGPAGGGKGPKGVWFDLFGSAFVVFRLHTLFALSVTLLIVAPLVLLATSVALAKVDRMYLFRTRQVDERGGSMSLQGLRGFFRFPFLLGVPTAVTIGLAYLITKFNPYIVHSSPYAVWGMMTSAWIFLAWFVSRIAHFARPSAFHRVYTYTWMFVLAWVLLVMATVYEHQRGLAGGYFLFFFFSGVFLATWVSYLELFALPRKVEYVNRFVTLVPPRPPPSPWSWMSDSHGEEEVEGEGDGHADDEQSVTESTSLLRVPGRRTTFANYRTAAGDARYRGHQSQGYYNNNNNNNNEDEPALTSTTYDNEQPWSTHLPKWTWILQVLLTVPVILMMIGPLSLLLTTALHQTGQDGGSPLLVYISIAGLTTLLLSPLLPFIHRYTYHLPILLLCAFIGTTIYNLVAFPFSESSRLKLFFIQEVDLDSGGANRASLTGIPPFVHQVVTALPSAAGQDIACDWYRDRVKCSWNGLEPYVVGPGEQPSKDWVLYNITTTPNTTSVAGGSSSSRSIEKEKERGKARFQISGQNTRACKIVFDPTTPVPDFHILGSAYDPQRFPHNFSEAREIRLWSREWNHTWTVDIDLPSENHDAAAADVAVKGRVVCLWSDQNQVDTIPALDEVKGYAPVWAAISKLGDGLVEGSKGFEISRSGSG